MLEIGTEYGIHEYADHPDAYDALTAEQLKTLAIGGTVPYAETADDEDQTEEDGESVDSKAEQKVEEEKPVIKTKDGKHTIPFEELESAREEASKWKKEAEEAKAITEQLKAANVKAAEKKPDETQQTQAEDPFGDYTPEALKKGIDQLVKAQIAEFKTAFEEEMGKKLTPLQASTQKQALTDHYQTIYEAHPDTDEICTADKIEKWIASQPSFVKKSMEEVYNSGTAEQVIELFNAYKGALPKQTVVAPTKAELEAKAKGIISKAKSKTPVSMSDMPSGENVPVDEAAAMKNATPMQFFNKFMTMKSPEEILKFASKVV